MCKKAMLFNLTFVETLMIEILSNYVYKRITHCLDSSFHHSFVRRERYIPEPDRMITDVHVLSFSRTA